MPILTLPTRLPGASPEVIGRWTVPVGDGSPAACDECGTAAVIGRQCPECCQLVAPHGTSGRLAVATTIGGRRLVVVAERTPGGGWAPVHQWQAPAQRPSA